MNARIHVVVVCAAMLAAVAGCGDDEGSDTSTGNTGAAGPGGSGAGGEGTGGMGTGGMGTGGGGGGMLVNGCSADMAEDMTGMPMVSLDWALGHKKCITVDVGTAVTWNGNFVSHPLSGGSPGSPDAASPITTSDQSGMAATVTFSAAGEFPYYCTVHNMGMQGVVYVE
jgi:plastocyanin